MQSQQVIDQKITEHYQKSNLTKNLNNALAEIGKTLDSLVPEDLAAMDEFHARGRLATEELAKQAELDKSKHVLDIGSGIGGPSRFLALNYGCKVTGIDLTKEYCQLASLFAEKFGLSERLKYIHGSALEMPFEDESFDIVWTQHVAMNIREKEKLYAEAVRCLKPNGTLIIYDILAGKNQPIHFPVPWSRSQETSFLATSAEMKSYLQNAGLKIKTINDRTVETIEWMRSMKENAEKNGPPKIGIHLVFGSDLNIIMGNMFRNLMEGRLEVSEFISIKT
ncbi:MAG TPA: class I SAM-dependent methyltransferase [candidate division Zixibacteria bacterium]|nr:class I SAM-dependent methyltransferase [candidate division Zixibacteria bacterium]